MQNASHNESAGNPGTVCAVLMPHAPILVPEVGGERSGAAAASCRAMRAAANCLLSHRPETVMLISPHAPRQPHAFGVWADELLRGSFAEFGAPEAEVTLPLDGPFAHAIAAEMRARDLQTWFIRHHPMDHGALVPLWFLAEAGWSGPTVILGLTHPSDRGLIAVGQAIAAAARSLPRRLALVASGDLSHRLTANAPGGFHPQARQFDETFIRLVRTGDYRRIESLGWDEREVAAEDAVDSTLIAAAAVSWQATGHQVLNYEGPFGVGYGVAILFAETPNSPDADATGTTLGKGDGALLPRLARRSVEMALQGSHELPPPPTGGYLDQQRGVFVTIRQPGGQLRGCRGTFEPVCPNVAAETWRSARLAALQDSRFTPVTTEEMGGLRFEVNVLHSPEAVASVDELDPSRYGVVVSSTDGRHALLLPGIEAIQTAEQQLRCAREKGAIGWDEAVAIRRFQADKFTENESEE